MSESSSATVKAFSELTRKIKCGKKMFSLLRRRKNVRIEAPHLSAIRPRKLTVSDRILGLTPF